MSEEQAVYAAGSRAIEPIEGQEWHEKALSICSSLKKERPGIFDMQFTPSKTPPGLPAVEFVASLYNGRDRFIAHVIIELDRFKEEPADYVADSVWYNIQHEYKKGMNWGNTYR